MDVYKVWELARKCYCSEDNCLNNHRLCAICNGKLLKAAHQSEQPNSTYAWNIDHKIPKSRGGTNQINNLQITHIECNSKKGG
ncbi:HNH endonuclease [Spiroplasma monobiae]|uniref:HNH nuclease domain-containing protein n=1 Tax=Spiroplasma monobiae MQ-1 TaxID=1336748 RepID=A0A2K9LUP0_SPISQ|nr:HNH endonuclease signature motif containing protein [Spiroplasma monobiae]AUM62767.1 hypothetical protein SMONO_v1c05180 [Spiroplasma monobiae MQ-1]